MIHSRLLRTVSVVMALILCALPLFVTGASAEEIPAEYNPDIPYIHVVGLMTSDIYENPDDPDSPTVWPPQTKNIVGGVAKLLPALVMLGITKNYDRFADRLVPALNGVLEPAFLSIDGEKTNTSGARCEYPARDEIKPNSKLWFDYDWRVDPFETAAQLDKFIDYVLDCSGCEQVVLECHSFGGVVTYTYASVYGTSKVRSFLFNASAVYGETFTGDLCQGKLVLDPDALTEYLKGAFAHGDGEKFLNGLFAFLNKVGITDAICGAVNRIVEHSHDTLYEGTILPMFANWPSIWSMVTDEMYEDSVDYIFNGFYKRDGADHSKMLEKVEKFHNTVAVNREEILKNINETSNLYVVCRYGYCSMFCTPSWRISNDMIIDARYASFGATAAPYGESFGADYLSGRDEKYISPKKNIDASTCLFPEQTWFIDDYMHMRSYPNDMFERLLYCRDQATVDTFGQYPRFLRYTDDDTVVAE